MSSSTSQIDALANKQREWRSLAPAVKLEYLQHMKQRLGHARAEQLIRNATTECVQTVLGIPLRTVEGDYRQSEELISIVTNLAATLDYLIQAFRVWTHNSNNDNKRTPEAIPHLATRQVFHGNNPRKYQWAVQVFPCLTEERWGPLAGVCRGEVFLDPTHVKTVKDIRLFTSSIESVVGVNTMEGKNNNEHSTSANKEKEEEGIAIVLGAGNFALLTIGDMLTTLFRYHRVTLVKFHPLREYMDAYLRYVMAPLIDLGYVEFCRDADFDRQGLYSPQVAVVHMTGGKATHDLIVWGSTEAERRQRRQQNQPKLQHATMSSELGCVTPWIMSHARFTTTELKAQALNIAKAVSANCSFACNSPKVVVVAAAWTQRQEFVDIITQYFQTHPTPVAYYPGAQQRWDEFHKHTSPSCLQVGCQLDVVARGLQPSIGQRKPVLLPFLINCIDVDLTTDAGRQAASTEYALRVEPFCPVLTICTIKSTRSPNDYLGTAVRVCNDYIFGSLSVSLSVPSTLHKDPMITQAVVDLRYGTVVVNGWSAFAYGLKGLPWGAYPGESLAAVESGSGTVNQYCFASHVQKGVVQFTSSGMPDLIFPSEESRATAAVNRAIVAMVQQPTNVWRIVKLLWCILVVKVTSIFKHWIK